LAARLAYMMWYGQLEQVALSVPHAERSLALAPDNPNCLVCSAVAFNATGDPERALHLVERAVQINPNSADAWGYNGLYLAILGRNSEALDMLNYAFELSPKDPVRYVWYSHQTICYANRDDYGSALAACQNSTRLHDQWFWTFMAQAQCHAMLGHHALARQDWQRAKELNESVSIENFEMWLTVSALSLKQRQDVVNSLRDAACS
jgi:adenylate cyclase